MLLPSDVARLVLGYLQQEGLTNSSRTFILESPSLKEYADHCTEDGLIPACMFSLFGKNLVTVLNEYVAAKTKEMSQESQVPAMLTSLWKKLDITLNQIKCVQNSPIVHTSQRMRTKSAIMRQRALQNSLGSASPVSVVVGDCASTPPSLYVSSPVGTPQVAPVRTPSSSSSSIISISQHTRLSPLCPNQIQDGSRVSVSQSHNTPLQVMVPDQRLIPGPLSPARRKCDSPRRRGGPPTAASGSARGHTGLLQEGQSEETVSENFPQMVIENAREKILKDRSLQEKLAENINKILASDNSPPASKVATSSVDHDQSIDEILGLQGEIHMTDNAIQDILEQTESDPAFQALFDLFDYGKNKANSTDDAERDQREQGSQDIPCTDEPTSDTIMQNPLQLDCTPCVPSSSSSSSSAPRSKVGAAQAPKNKRKSTASSSSVCKNAAPTVNNPPADASQPVSINQALDQRSAFSDPKQRGRKRYTQAPQLSSQGSRCAVIVEEEVEEMECIEVDNFEAPEMDLVVPLMDTQPEAGGGGGSTGEPTGLAGKSLLMETTSVLPLETASAVPLSGPLLAVSAQEISLNGQAGKMPQSLDGPSANKGVVVVGELDHPGKRDHLISSLNAKSHQSQERVVTQVLQSPHATRGSSAIISSAVTTSTPASASRPATATAAASAASPLVTQSDPSQIVSLKIIVSDDKEPSAPSSADATLSQAVSSIVTTHDERLPTIYLSSPPPKSPAKGLLLSSNSGVTSEETMLAVSSLQRTELPTPAGADGPQEAGLFQLLPMAAGPSSYFVVTDKMAAPGDCRPASVVVVPASAPTSQGQVMNSLPQVATPPRSHALPQSYGSTIIISSPGQVQSMLQCGMVPVSVMGQNNAGKLNFVPNHQVITVPCRPVTQPSLVAKPKPAARPANSSVGKTVKSSSSSSSSGPHQNVAVALTSPSAAATTKTAAPPGHVRMLRFDQPSSNSPAQPPSQSSAAPVRHDNSKQTRSSPPAKKQTSAEGGGGGGGSVSCKNPSPKPIILGGGSRASRRRVEIQRVGDITPQPSAFPDNNRDSSGKEDQSSRDRSVKESSKRTGASESRATSKATTPPAVEREVTSSTESGRTRSQSRKPDMGNASVVNAQGTRASSAEHRAKSSTQAKRDEQESATKSQSSTITERPGPPPQEEPSPTRVAANKENEQETQKHPLTERSSVGIAGRLRESTTTATATSAASAGPCKALSKTSPLTKQAAEMLQDIQSLNPLASPAKKPGLELPLPRTPGLGRGLNNEDYLDGLRTPSRTRQGRDNREGTPRHLRPPATPELPTCSPASETGSESSINMAAHTLMILSRAARTGVPLKDRPRSTGKSKKRKQGDPSPSDKSSGKKPKKQKKILDSFPDDLDVDKFLSSLHYDE
ncbi:protein NPAT [Engraulis encrasicolus]|uniref:protein NPAT n=1 Tax=Engraulis encrasicolus TaxID=184585 RepID=UPI002FCE769B